MVRRAVAVVVSTVLLAVGLTGCSPARPAPPDTAEAHTMFGAPAKPDGTFDLQKDVVTVGGGRNSVWAIDTDGFRVVLDANAQGVADLREGSVLLATGYATGRVASISRSGDRTTVALVPVALNEIIRNGTVTSSTSFSPTDLAWNEDVQPDPVELTTYRRDSSDPDIRLVSAARPMPGIKGSAGDLQFDVATTSTGYSFSITTKATAKVKIGVSVNIVTSKLTANASTTIRDGEVVGSSSSMSGISELGVDLKGGSSEVGGTTGRLRVSIPISVPKARGVVIEGGIPFSWKLKPKVDVSFGLVGTNSTISGHGAWKFANPISAGGTGSGSTVKTTTYVVVQSLLETLQGIAPGGAAMTVSLDLKLVLGVGIPEASAGIWPRVVFTVGGGIGSAYGAPLALCVKATLEVRGGAAIGVDLELPKTAKKLLEKTRLGKVLASTDEFRLIEGMGNIVPKQSYTLPDKAICKTSDD